MFLVWPKGDITRCFFYYRYVIDPSGEVVCGTMKVFDQPLAEVALVKPLADLVLYGFGVIWTAGFEHMSWVGPEPLCISSEIFFENMFLALCLELYGMPLRGLRCF